MVKVIPWLMILPFLVDKVTSFHHRTILSSGRFKFNRSNIQLAAFDTTIIHPAPITCGFLLVGIAAVRFQGTLLEGKSGLSNFLKDGKGWQGSAYQPEERTRVDPMPWLKLPKLDFVEVYGSQESEVEEANKSDDKEKFDHASDS
jgi:hypothetical protein